MRFIVCRLVYLSPDQANYSISWLGRVTELSACLLKFAIRLPIMVVVMLLFTRNLAGISIRGSYSEVRIDGNGFEIGVI